MSDVKKEIKKEEFEIRDMDRDQIKSLRKAGVDPSFVNMDSKNTAEFVDFILDNIYPDVDFKGVPFYKLSKLAFSTYRRAWSGPEEVKN